MFSVFSTPRFAAEIGGNAAEIGGNAAGMRREFPESKRCCSVFALVAAFFLFAADFLECGGNFRRNALRQKFPPQEVLGMWAKFHLLYHEKKNRPVQTTSRSKRDQGLVVIKFGPTLVQRSRCRPSEGEVANEPDE